VLNLAAAGVFKLQLLKNDAGPGCTCPDVLGLQKQLNEIGDKQIKTG